MDKKSFFSSIIAAILSGILIFISPETNEIKDPNITNKKMFNIYSSGIKP